TVVVSPDGRRCATLQVNDEPPNLIVVYDLNLGRELCTIPSLANGVVVFSPDGTRLIADQSNLWDITTTLPKLVGSDMNLRLEFSPDGRWIRAWPGASGPHQTAALLDAATFAKLPLRPDVSDVTLAPDGRTIADRELVPPTMFHQYMAEWLGLTPPF